MLAQATERVEPHETGRKRAAIHPLLVSWTREMTIKGVQCPESAVAEHTFVCITVPRPLCGDPSSIVTISNQARWVRDNAMAILLFNPSVDHVAVGTGDACPSFEVRYHCCLADKPLRATIVLECTRYVLWTMHARVQVLHKYQ